jgi:thioredoxin reductase
MKFRHGVSTRSFDMENVSLKVPSAEQVDMAARWLGAFESAVNASDTAALTALFTSDGCWRDVLAFTWDLQTFSGRDVVESAFQRILPSWTHGPFELLGEADYELTSNFGPPLVQAAFEFATAMGHGKGLVRLLVAEAEGKQGRAWTLMTALEKLHGGEGHLGPRRPKRAVEGQVFGGPNWLDHRMRSSRYEDRDPEVLVVGGGQAGLSLAARLRQLDIDTLIVDRHERVGDNWRNRYHSLTLHNEIWSNHLPYMPFPRTWPIYIPKDKLANWFESYAESMELNFWTGIEFTGGEYSAAERRWSVRLRDVAGNTVRTMSPRHVVIATGVSGIPNIPEIPGLGTFKGPICHSTDYVDGSAYRGKRVLVVGTGNSGHDVAFDLHHAGASVAMLQRSPTTVVSLEPSAHRFYATYSEDGDTNHSDLLSLSVPYPLMVKMARKLTAEACVSDGDILDRLEAVGFKMDLGEDGTGWQFKYLRYGGGYYINIGCSDLVANREIGLYHHEDVDKFAEGGLLMRDGRVVPFDACVLATGYKDMQTGVRFLFGDEVAERVGPVWGFDDQGEMRNVWKRTPQEGLWFMMGSITQCRIYSTFLAMQIWAQERGLVASLPSVATTLPTSMPGR